MILMWLGISILSFIAIAAVFYPLVKARRAAPEQLRDTREEDNIAVFKDRLSELELERLSGSLADTEFEALKLELEKNLLIDTEAGNRSIDKPAIVSSKHFVAIVLAAFLVPVSALGLYMKVGSADQLSMSMNLSADPFEGRQPTMDEALAQLQLELEANPNNAEGWYLLGSNFMAQGRYDAGLEALLKVENLLTEEDPQYSSILGQVAQAMFFAEGSMTDSVRAKIDETLAFEPFEITALGLKGIDAFEQQNYREAIAAWQKAMINADGETASSFESGILRARDALAERGEDVADIEIPQIARIPLTLDIAAELAEGLAPDTPVFVVARPIAGGMPLAAVRLTLADLPSSLELSDSQSMSPEARLSSAEEVSVSARVSLSGNVTPQPGDMIVEVSPVPTKGLEMPLELLVQEVVK